MSGLELFSYYYLLLMSVYLLSEIGWEYKQDCPETLRQIPRQTKTTTRQQLDNHWYWQTQHKHNFPLNALSIMIILLVFLHVSYHDYLLCPFSLILVSVSFSHDFEVKNMKTIMMIVMMICWELVMMTLNINELSSIRVYVSLMFIVWRSNSQQLLSNKQIS